MRGFHEARMLARRFSSSSSKRWCAIMAPSSSLKWLNKRAFSVSAAAMSAVVGIDARGFIHCGPLKTDAARCKLPFFPCKISFPSQLGLNRINPRELRTWVLLDSLKCRFETIDGHVLAFAAIVTLPEYASVSIGANDAESDQVGND
jgi:hypothetical protein